MARPIDPNEKCRKCKGDLEMHRSLAVMGFHWDMLWKCVECGQWYGEPREKKTCNEKDKELI